MRKLILLWVLSFSISAVYSQSVQDTIDNPYWSDMMFDRTVSYSQTKRAYDLYFSNKEKKKGTGYKQFERWAYNAKNDLDENGNYKPSDYIVKEFDKFKKNSLNSRSSQPKWTSIGPFNNPAPASMNRGVGRINVIAYHPTNPNIVYAGAPSGGFWYSNDKGENWIQSNTDDKPRFGVSAIGVIPVTGSEPIILIGTGDRDANDAPGLGIYVSYDGGVNFTESNDGISDNTVVNKIVVSKDNPDVIFAATTSGMYKSEDQGQSWDRKSSLDFIDVHFHPTDETFMYASSRGLFYRSINGGESWTAVSTGFSSVSKRRMAIAVSKASPDLVYVISVRTSDNGMEGLYRSTDKGESFTMQLSGTTYNPLGFNSTGTGSGGQGFYDLAIESSPTDPDIVYVGGINLFKSINGGKNFTCVAFWSFHPTIPWVHADIHYLGRNPLTDELYIGSDGGIDYTVNEGSSYNNRNNGLAISQFYNLGISQLSQTKFITGAQDNGTSMGSSKDAWRAELGGDGMECEVSNFDTTIMFGASQYGNIQRTTNNGTNWRGIVNSISERPGPWVTPYHVHPYVDNIMVAAYRNVWVSKNVVTSNNPSFSRETNSITSEGSAVRFSNVNNNYVFVGWENGTLRYSSNILSSSPTFNAINSVFGNGEVNDIETSFHDVNTLYVAKGTRIFKTTDLGVNWENISFNLPSINIHCVVLDKNSNEGLYIGTDAGVYYKDSLMSEWVLFSNGLSLNAPVRDIEIVYNEDCEGDSKIFAASYGRGLWLGNVYGSSGGGFKITTNDDNTICKGEAIVVALEDGDNYSYTVTSDIKSLDGDKFELKPSADKQYKFYSRKSSSLCEVRYFDVKVNLLPDIKVDPNSKTIDSGENLKLTASGANSYEWSPVDFVLGESNTSTLEIEPFETITYTLKGISSDGCESTKEVTINVRGSGTTSSLHGVNEANIKIFPNPSKEKLLIQSNEPSIIRLFDISGALIVSRDVSMISHILDVSSFAIGTYNLEVIGKSGLRSSHNILINR